MGLTGADEAAAALRACLEPAGVVCDFQALPDYPTITKLRAMSRHQQLIRMDFEDGFGGYDSGPLLGRYRGALADCDAVVLSDYGKGTLAPVAELIAAARTAGRPVVIDPKGTDFARYRGATLLTPNLHEFEAVVGACADVTEIERRGEALRTELDLHALLVTRSEQGMTLIEAGRAPLHIPTRAREVYDVTGAGDTVVSVIAAGLAAGEDLASAVVLANLAAGVVVGKLGTATASVEELRRALREDEAVEQGVVSAGRLAELASEARAHGETLVMTNGCFDILHEGHVRYLDEARALGDRLIVAVNSDASVSGLKGPGRPVNPLESRMAVLAALRSVDWVVPFDAPTPEALICAISPQILVKGGDYSPEQIAGAQCVREAGGEVRIIEFVDGHSTTSTIARIRALS
jgi:D-beta-D-heptose 7-phosphate kinase/D-beta-D-heptose 1-phosphate adenosyltransferase